jgi:hypothetical protein
VDRPHLGEKQRGRNAELHDNTHDPQIYDDVWTEERLNSPRRCMEIEALLKQIG